MSDEVKNEVQPSSWKTELLEKYKDTIFKEKDLPMNQTCMCWGLAVKDGWRTVLEDLCGKLDYIRNVTGVRTIAKQVKEKFGGLRFYYITECDGEAVVEMEAGKCAARIIQDLVSTAERAASDTCEFCGAEWFQGGGVHTHAGGKGYIHTWCEECCVKYGVKTWAELQGSKGNL